MSKEVHIVAIMYPKEGKADRLRAILAQACEDVHSKEDYTSRFIVTEQLDKETPDFVLFETYNDKDSAQQHTKEPHFKAMFKTFEDEGIMAKPPTIYFTQTKSGFDSDRKLLKL